MEKYSRMLRQILFISILFTTACDSNREIIPNSELTTFEEALVGNWKYVSIEVLGKDYIYADKFTEPGTQIISTIGRRAELERRIINYSKDKTYQLRWTDRGNYELGTYDEPNWQPNFGSWYHNPENDSVYHNAGLHYSISYKISIASNKLRRVSRRIMSSEKDDFLGRPWNKGDEVIFTEIFQRVD